MYDDATIYRHFKSCVTGEGEEKQNRDGEKKM
jgi:hypothetical protein